jgi:hypothetical protein
MLVYDVQLYMQHAKAMIMRVWYQVNIKISGASFKTSVQSPPTKPEYVLNLKYKKIERKTFNKCN